MISQGGGWCESVEKCLSCKETDLGSSKQMVKQFGFSGLLSSQQKSNPGRISQFPSGLVLLLDAFILTDILFEHVDFYNWNRIKVRYCDGSSFTGDLVNPVSYLNY